MLGRAVRPSEEGPAPALYALGCRTLPAASFTYNAAGGRAMASPPCCSNLLLTILAYYLPTHIYIYTHGHINICTKTHTHGYIYMDTCI